MECAHVGTEGRLAVNEQLIPYAVLAPSPHNNQPWRFETDGPLIRVLYDPARALPALDPGGSQSYLALGAAVENLCVAARGMGLAPAVQLCPAGEENPVAAEVRLAPGSPAGEDDRRLMAAIQERCTVRGALDHRPLAAGVLADLQQAVAPDEGRLYVVDQPEAIRSAARLMGQAEQFGAELEPVAREVYRWLRFSQQEARQTGDGLWVKTLEMGPVVERMARPLLRWERLRLLNRAGVNRLLGLVSRGTAGRSAAIALLTVPHGGLRAYLGAGRAFQRVGLRAVLHGVGLHPMNFAVILGLHGRHHAAGMDPRHLAAATAMDQGLRTCFGVPAREELAILFRMGCAAPPQYRSDRRPMAVTRTSAMQSIWGRERI